MITLKHAQVDRTNKENIEKSLNESTFLPFCNSPENVVSQQNVISNYVSKFGIGKRQSGKRAFEKAKLYISCQENFLKHLK
uniref:DRBM domain-containing protein n=1 Tax=Strongyloides venezuelensis TaxID=75913 RepID=A0A0K0FG54_STRVS